ncbi:hypothetical protein B0H16DRAFT_1689459 [Mycena metata]|uniref:Uncharacterized protein n=1 Tax=Mycena metata TaxID=1033252 RepID=A0AAD7NFG7_9AGAR|nr:hypothetical protein B0H16DRAFT_1689459 [Mycena metata]
MQRLATGALNGSLESLHKICERIDSESTPSEQALLFLPVFYETLDPLRIPNIDDSDLSSMPDSMVLAGRTLDGLSKLTDHTWEFFLNTNDESLREAGADDVFLWIKTLVFSEPSNIDEYIEGAGGTLDDFAALIVQHIHLVTPTRDTKLSALQASILTVTHKLIAALDGIHDDQDVDTFTTEPRPLSEAVRRLGTSQLTIAACALSHANIAAAGPPLKETFKLLDPGPYGNLGARLYLTISVRSGLLLSLVASTHMMDAVVAALPDVELIVKTPAFAKTPFSRVWRKFAHMVAERRWLLEEIDSNDRVMSKTCDNIEAAGVHITALNHVVSPTGIEVVTAPSATLIKRCPSQIAFMYKNPDADFFLEFDYLNAMPIVSVYDAQASGSGRAMANVAPAEWPLAMERAGRSAGRMELHVLVASLEHQWLVPLPVRRTGARVLDELRRIAGEIPRGVEEVDTPLLDEVIPGWRERLEPLVAEEVATH